MSSEIGVTLPSEHTMKPQLLHLKPFPPLGLLFALQIFASSLGPFLSQIAASAEPENRGIVLEGVKPLAQHSAGNAAMFVGVNEFTDDSLRALRFAVNDAIAQADLFVTQLCIIPASNAVLLVSGTPSTPALRAKLESLRQAGVHIGRATRTEMFRQFNFVANVPRAKSDLIVISFSTHGFERDGIAYVMPEDGNRSFLADTGFRLKTAEQVLERSFAGKRLLLVDACREKVGTDDKSIGGEMTEKWREALAMAQGQAVLASCDVGQFSYEDPNLNHGVFTHFLLSAMAGQAPVDERGFITFGGVSDFVSSGVRNWVVKNKPGLAVGQAQRPWFKGPNDAREIPLAVSNIAADRQRELEARRRKALNYLTDARKAQRTLISAQAEEDIEAAANKLSGAKLEELLEQLEDLQAPSAARVKAFMSWWNTAGRQLAGAAPSPAPVPSPIPTTPTNSPAPVTAPAPRVNLPQAGQRWTNGLGMVFVPVKDTPVLFCIWETRVQDYEPFVKDKGLSWAKPEWERFSSLSQGPLHPAANVSWNDAREYCKWLTERERKEGRIGPDSSYRLPTDEEWSRAVGLGPEPGNTPAEKHLKREGFPFERNSSKRGRYKGSGNGTATVGSYDSNRYGLYDLGGNVWEWCEDSFKTGADDKVLRGAAWKGSESAAMFEFTIMSSFRLPRKPDSRQDDAGFRCVLQISKTPSDDKPAAIVPAQVPSPSPAPSSTTATVVTPAPMATASSARPGQPFTNSLGMIFVPVKDTQVLFCIWETRVQDYQPFVKDKGMGWANPDWERYTRRNAQTPLHPASNVSWTDAKAYCQWLTEKERKEGRIGPDGVYRLPTDEEWSRAAGLGFEPGNTPADKHLKTPGYPFERNTPHGKQGHYKYQGIGTSSVGSYYPNRYGLYDLAGNVWEWCEDSFNAGAHDRFAFGFKPGADDKVLRGAAWKGTETGYLAQQVVLSSFRLPRKPDNREDDAGFRCVFGISTNSTGK